MPQPLAGEVLLLVVEELDHVEHSDPVEPYERKPIDRELPIVGEPSAEQAHIAFAADELRGCTEIEGDQGIEDPPCIPLRGVPPCSGPMIYALAVGGEQSDVRLPLTMVEGVEAVEHGAPGPVGGLGHR